MMERIIGSVEIPSSYFIFELVILFSPILLRYYPNMSIFLSQLLANQWNRGWGDVSSHDVLFTFRFFLVRLCLEVKYF